MVRISVPVNSFSMDFRMLSIGERLKEERERLGFTIPAFAEAAGAKKNTVIDWQKDVSSPPATRLAALMEVGVDVMYVLTGQRTPAQTAKRPPLDDRERLALATEVVTEGLADVGKKLPPRKLAELILAAYDLMADPVQSKDNVIQLIRKIA